jgi:hypothetical protein
LGAWGVQVIKEHHWFSGLDWNHVLNRNYKPPRVPTVDPNDEASNFDSHANLGPMKHAFILKPEQQAHFIDF